MSYVSKSVLFTYIAEFSELFLNFTSLPSSHSPVDTPLPVPVQLVDRNGKQYALSPDSLDVFAPVASAANYVIKVASFRDNDSIVLTIAGIGATAEYNFGVVDTATCATGSFVVLLQAPLLDAWTQSFIVGLCVIVGGTLAHFAVPWLAMRYRAVVPRVPGLPTYEDVKQV